MSSDVEGLRESLARTVTTVCHCWRLTRRDGQTRGYTDHDAKLIVDGTPCQPLSGFTATEARDRLGLGTDTADIDGVLSADDISEADIERGQFDGTVVETFLVDWSDTNQHVLLRKAVIGKITRRDGQFTAELLSQAESLDRVNGRFVRRSCDAELGDSRCGVSLDTPTLRGTGEVLRREGQDALIVSGLADHRTGWFSHGRLTWTGGANTGRTERVLEHVRRFDGVMLKLWRDSAASTELGDSFEISAGCDKQFATCKAKFGNQVNFRGFPHLPGNDAAYGYVTDGVTFDGGPIVP